MRRGPKSKPGSYLVLGNPRNGEGLRPRDPVFDIPYVEFDGRTGRSGGKAAKFCWL